jgi:hypothetical protein
MKYSSVIIALKVTEITQNAFLIDKSSPLSKNLHCGATLEHWKTNSNKARLIPALKITPKNNPDSLGPEPIKRSEQYYYFTLNQFV